jgi:Ca2+-binding RTX toxin-like protein
MAILTLTDSNPNANIATEGVNSAVAIDINATGGNGNYLYSIAYDPTGGAFAIDVTGIVSIVDETLIDYEALVDGKLILTIHVQDNAGNYGDAQFTINVTDVNGETPTPTAGVDETGVGGFDSSEEEDTINGLGDDDILDGLGGNDTITGGDDDDEIDGGDGNDILFGNAGDDTILGGDGDDIIEGGDKDAAFDDLNGGAGFDILSYAASDDAVTIDLENNTADGGHATDDQIANFEGVIGSVEDDEITGRDGDDLIEGGKGADTLDGAGDDITADFVMFDTVSYASSSAGVTVSLGKQGVTTTGEGGDAEDDTLVNFENIVGSGLADTLKIAEYGMVEGGAGADIMTASEGGTLSYSSSTAAVTIAFAAAGKTGTGVGGHAQGDKFTNFESVFGSNYDDKLTGNEIRNDLLGGTGDDVLTGNAGNDFLFGDNYVESFALPFGYAHLGGNDKLLGGEGDDYLQGGIGSDIIEGGNGFDIASYQGSTAAVTIVLGTKGATAVQTGGDAGGDKLTSVEGIIGTDFADKITGNELDNLIEGGAGADTLTGGGGNGSDTVSYARAVDTGGNQTGVTVNLNNQDGVLKQAGDSDEDDDILFGFENVIGSFFDDVLTGDAFDNIIEGGGGADDMDGGLGHDIVSYRNYDNLGGTDGVTVALSVGGSLIVSGTGDQDGDTGTSFEGVHGSAYDDTLAGYIDDNTILGLDGDDLIDGFGGADYLDGGDGTDTLDYSDSGAVTLTLGGTNAKTTVTAVDGNDTILNFENVIGSAFEDKLTGNNADNVFQGGAGKDLINGGGGSDTADYSDAAASVTVVLGTGVTKVTGGDTDEISSIENVIGSTGNDVLTGNSSANVLLGGAGDDEITGGGGADILDGGANDDTFYFTGNEGLGDTILGGSGTDRIEIKGSVAATIENFSQASGSIEEFQGNGLGILGTAKNNVLDFSGLSHYAGVASIDGLAGDDNIKAFATKEAVLFGNTGDDTLIGGNLADKLDGGDGDDSLVGGLEADTLVGGDGDDQLVGDAGKDTLTGGAGADLLIGGGDDDIFNVTGTEATFDVFVGGGGTGDTIEILGSAAVTFNRFNAATNEIEVLKGNDGAILGTNDDNLLDFSGMTINSVAYIDGGAGNDKIVASASGDNLKGGAGDDFLQGGAAIDTLNGGAGIDTIRGGGDNDIIVVAGTEAQYDDIDGEGGTNTLKIEGSASLTLSMFVAAASNIQTVQGNGKSIVGDADNNTLNFAGVTITGTGLPFVDGGAGNDAITAWAAGADLRGGSGDDTLNGGAGKDSLTGGAGIDTINGGGNDDTIFISGSDAQFDVIDGGADSDTIHVTGSSAVTLHGFDSTASNNIELWIGNGKGVLGNQVANQFDFSGLTNAGNVGVIDGLGGNDIIIGSAEDDDIRGGIGDDTLSGGDGDDTLIGGTGVDILNGDAGADTFIIGGTDGQFDTISGGADDDTLSLTTATVTLTGLDSIAADLEILAGKSTTILGTAGSNTFDLRDFTSVTGIKAIDAGAGNDILFGADLASVADDLRGNAGNDTLTGGKGNDTLTGGSGIDTFVFITTDFGKDTVTDFSGFDVIRFENSMFADFDAVQDAMTQVGANTVITFDDGNTVTLTNVTASLLTTANFDLV